MIKNAKLLFLLCILIVISGCSSRVNIKLDKKNHVKETINISESSNQDYLLEESVNGAIKYYDLDTNKYKVEKFFNSDTYGINITNESDNICYELKDSYFSSFFDNVNCEEKKSNYIINASSKYTYCKSKENGCSQLDDISITFDLPESAIDSNADEISGNKYTWNFDRETKEKSIYLNIKKYNTILKNVDNVKEAVVKEKNYVLGIMIVFGIFLLGAIFVYLFYKKYVKKEEEY